MQFVSYQVYISMNISSTLCQPELSLGQIICSVCTLWPLSEMPQKKQALINVM